MKLHRCRRQSIEQTTFYTHPHKVFCRHNLVLLLFTQTLRARLILHVTYHVQYLTDTPHATPLEPGGHNNSSVSTRMTRAAEYARRIHGTWCHRYWFLKACRPLQIELAPMAPWHTPSDRKPPKNTTSVVVTDAPMLPTGLESGPIRPWCQGKGRTSRAPNEL